MNLNGKNGKLGKGLEAEGISFPCFPAFLFKKT
jgi:hypothetical protein